MDEFVGIRCKCLECVSNISGHCRDDIIEIDENGECTYLYLADKI